MNSYWQHVILFLKRFIWLLALYSVSRLFFYVLNTGYFSGSSFPDILETFIAGVRFDIATILFINVIFIIILLPGNYKNKPGLQKTFDILFFTVNALALLSNFIDAKFFDFINKRSTSSIFTMLGTNKDVWLLFPQFIKDYWYVALTWIILMAGFWRWMPRLKHNKVVAEKFSIKYLSYQLFVFAGIMGMILLGARGTGLKPICIIDAASYTELKLVPLVINTPFSILKTMDNQNLKPLTYFNEDSVFLIYNPVHSFHRVQEFNKKNVVIIILESFSKEYSGFLGGQAGYTPFLDSMLEKSLVFTNAFANGTQSYEAMPAIIAGIPSLMDEPYSGSNYAGNLIESLPGLLRQEGYHTSFFHGGNNGTMGFSNFAKVAGTEHYFGRDEYGNDADFDGHWGIWDEPFLQYFASKLNVFPQPFFSTIFTLSSHHPYNVPEKYTNKFKEGVLPILKSVSYADFALRAFFKTACQMPWYNNTLFVFTADHAAQAVERIYNSTTGIYAIPVAFYCPSDSTLNGKTKAIAQQIDIMPTVLDYLNYPKSFFAFGESLIDSTGSRLAISFLNGMYQMIEGDFVMLFNGKKVISFYNWTNQLQKQGVDSYDSLVDPVLKANFLSMESRIKAIVQTYNACLINNRTSLHQNSIATGQSPFEIK